MSQLFLAEHAQNVYADVYGILMRKTTKVFQDIVGKRFDLLVEFLGKEKVKRQEKYQVTQAYN